MFNSQVSLVNRSQGLEKEGTFKNLGLHSRSAMQWDCDLRLSLNNSYSLYITVPHSTWSVVLRPLFVFLFDKWAHNDPV